MKRTRGILIVLFCAMQAAGAGAAAPELPADLEAFLSSVPEERTLPLGIADALSCALAHNADIRITRYDRILADKAVTVAGAPFEPVFSAAYTVNDTEKRSSSSLGYSGLSVSRSLSAEIGLSGKLQTGTTYDASLSSGQYKSNSSLQIYNPYYTTAAQLALTHPLMRGSGSRVNGADITIAKNNALISNEQFTDRVIRVISDTKKAYYTYLYARENYRIARLAKDRAADLHAISRARYEKGLISSVDLLETEAALAERQKALIAAESACFLAEDELKVVTNLVEDPVYWNARIELTDEPMLGIPRADLVQSLRDAFSYRADYAIARVDLHSRDVKIRVAQDALWPTLDLAGSYALNGLADSYGRSADDISPKRDEWMLGLHFSVPWGGSDRAAFDERKTEKEQALIAFKQLEQTIVLEVRNKVREIDIQYRNVEANNLLKEKETANYTAQRQRYAAGEVSTHDMLDYENRLMNAELGHIRSLIDYAVALVDLARSTGTTLRENGIRLQTQGEGERP